MSRYLTDRHVDGGAGRCALTTFSDRPPRCTYNSMLRTPFHPFDHILNESLENVEFSGGELLYSPAMEGLVAALELFEAQKTWFSYDMSNNAREMHILIVAITPPDTSCQTKRNRNPRFNNYSWQATELEFVKQNIHVHLCLGSQGLLDYISFSERIEKSMAISSGETYWMENRQDTEVKHLDVRFRVPSTSKIPLNVSADERVRSPSTSMHSTMPSLSFMDASLNAGFEHVQNVPTDDGVGINFEETFWNEDNWNQDNDVGLNLQDDIDPADEFENPKWVVPKAPPTSVVTTPYGSQRPSFSDGLPIQHANLSTAGNIQSNYDASIFKNENKSTAASILSMLSSEKPIWSGNIIWTSQNGQPFSFRAFIMALNYRQEGVQPSHL